MTLPTQPKFVIQQWKTNVGIFIQLTNSNVYYHSLYINDQCTDILPKMGRFFRIPSPVERVCRKTVTNPSIRHFELINEELASDKLPKIITDFALNDDDEWVLNGMSGIHGLYNAVMTEPSESYVDIDFEVVDMGEYDIKEPNSIQNRKIETIRNDTWDKVATVDLSSIVSYEDIVEMITPEFALQQAPCFLTSKQVYGITRNYILKNINLREATITSNYDFCFAVSKLIHTKPYMATEIYATGKSLKTKTRNVTKDTKKIPVFEMTWAGYKGKGGYDGYTCIPEIHGKNIEDLHDTLTTFLEGIIEKINTPVKECECCGGIGFVSSSNQSLLH